MKPSAILSFALITTAGVATASVASAQVMPKPGACRADARKLCPDAVAAMDRSKVQACLIQKIAEVSPDCKENMVAMKAAQAAPAGTKQ